MSVPCKDIFLKKDFARDAVCSLHCIDSIFHLAEKEIISGSTSQCVLLGMKENFISCSCNLFQE